MLLSVLHDHHDGTAIMMSCHAECLPRALLEQNRSELANCRAAALGTAW
jgi:hypothetical protein